MKKIFVPALVALGICGYAAACDDSVACGSDLVVNVSLSFDNSLCGGANYDAIADGTAGWAAVGGGTVDPVKYGQRLNVYRWTGTNFGSRSQVGTQFGCQFSDCGDHIWTDALHIYTRGGCWFSNAQGPYKAAYYVLSEYNTTTFNYDGNAMYTTPDLSPP